MIEAALLTPSGPECTIPAHLPPRYDTRRPVAPDSPIASLPPEDKHADPVPDEVRNTVLSELYFHPAPATNASLTHQLPT